MGRIFRWLLFLLLLLALALGVWWRLRPQPLKVTVQAVEQGAVERLVANTRAGTVKACRQANLSPSVGGQIVRLPAKKGERVAAGALLLELWNDNILAQIELGKSEGQAAAARAAALGRQVEKAGRDAERLRKLRERAISSEQDLDAALSQLATREAEYAATLADEKSSRERLRVLAAELERTRLLAPFPGVIAEVNGELNEYVTPSPPGIPTPPALILLDTSCFYVNAPIDEVDAEAIQIGMATRITLDAFRERNFAGRVRRIDPYVVDREKQARTVQVEVEFTEPAESKSFLSGYSADVEIVIARRSNVLRIPSQALMAGQRVFVLDPQAGRLRERKIGTGLANWEVTEVTGGLEAGELVLLSTDLPGVREGAAAVRGGQP